jgi:hypothetical protein
MQHSFITSAAARRPVGEPDASVFQVAAPDDQPRDTTHVLTERGLVYDVTRQVFKKRVLRSAIFRVKLHLNIICLFD